jgi:radical SAM superfamily enzyme YgiQ (UPF0313 family)
MVDVLFVSVPLTVTNVAPAAPAILISMIERAGFTGKFYDFNRHVNDDENFSQYAVSDIKPSDTDKFDKDFKYHVQQMIDYNPKYIGISIFSYQCARVAKLLCVYLRMLAPEIKIILGGQGLTVGGIQGHHLGEEWKKLKLCDYWVVSEGEWPIVDILTEKHKNKKTWTQIEDLNEFPAPNYSSYDWSLYIKSIPITGSRGCVRRCTFCDIHTHWKKFVFRSGKSIADEMIAQSKRYGVTHFTFTDSLINGSMKAYIDLITVLAEYNSIAKIPLTWDGQFIFRPKNQMPEKIWKLSAEAGLVDIAIGVESLSESVRDHMRKKFSNDDIRFSLYCMKKYRITGLFLMIVGYVTEDETTIKETKDMFTELVPYANNTISGVEVGSTLSILPGTPLDDMHKELGITLSNHENTWVGNSNIDTRLRWRKEIIEHCDQLGYNVQAQLDQLVNKLENESDSVLYA